MLAPGSILHHSFNGCADVIVRSARYSGPKAAILRDKGETSPAWMLPIRGLAAFAKSYCLQGGWREMPSTGSVYFLSLSFAVCGVGPSVMGVRTAGIATAPGPTRVGALARAWHVAT